MRKKKDLQELMSGVETDSFLDRRHVLNLLIIKKLCEYDDERQRETQKLICLAVVKLKPVSFVTNNLEKVSYIFH